MLLYELPTGKTSFDTKELLAAGLDAMRRTIREQEPVRPSTRRTTMAERELTMTERRVRSGEQNRTAFASSSYLKRFFVIKSGFAEVMCYPRLTVPEMSTWDPPPGFKTAIH